MLSWQQQQQQTNFNQTTKFPPPVRSNNHNASFFLLRRTPLPTARVRVARCLQQQQQQILFTEAEVPSSSSTSATANKDKDNENEHEKEEEEKGVVEEEEEEEEDEGISGIEVPRQRYISVPKSHLLSAILSSIFHSKQDISQDFTRFSSCLDSILHAEHKGILEEMRVDYTYPSSSTTHSPSPPSSSSTKTTDPPSPNGKAVASDRSSKPLPFNYSLDLSFLLGSPVKETSSSTTKSSVPVASRFQRAFLKLLQDAQFEELSARDLLLTSSLNTDYLLTLPIYVDWKKASESNAIIFRRGYATEKQKGLLIVEKLDYIQSKLLQGIFFGLSKPLGKVGRLVEQAFESASQKQDLQIWVERVKLWLKKSFSQQSYSDDESTSDKQLVSDQQSTSDLPIWLAAQKAIPRYEGFLSSVGPRGRLLRKLLIKIGLIPTTPKTSLELDSESTISEHYQRPSFLSRISLGDIWRPATKEYCGNDILKMLKTAFSILFSQSTLQEPAFQELILLYSEEKGQRESEDEAEMSSLKLKIYERIPIPDLQVVFPHKRLSFRIIDTVRLDAASILGLLAFFVNYKFENILSSPSAVLLDVIAVTAFIVYLARLALGYKQTWDRYQLLVNRTLYEKTLASGFGSVHFLLDASEQQQYKEAILAYAVLLGAKEGQMTSLKFVADTCEKFMYNNFKEKVEMPVDKAINTLLRLGLVSEVFTDGNMRLQALPCSEGYAALKRHWDLLLS